MAEPLLATKRSLEVWSVHSAKEPAEERCYCEMERIGKRPNN